ncbi:phage holin family protein [Pseudomonas sp. Gutcm_11s]|uniref:phage holin family protein n=1 Tax=Pseudomonas sp. Gutcm_11s TaxID=3026088 RepID=UPI00235EAD51|nr:phage holin family protein [Pseudomonas sp. Gutcm_11s]MDD0843908.1 phage holin family protein [Pseudomonas sp. Gutcm_11s]
MQEDLQQPAAEAPKPSLKKLGGAFVGLLQGHLELLGIEIQEEKSRSFRLFVFSGLSLIFGLLVLLALSTVVLIACWDTYRLPAAIGLCVVYAAALLLCVRKAMCLAREGESPFRATLAELARDKERLLP